MGLLEKRVAIITGAGQGIGKGIAIEFAREGADVVVADLNLENAKIVSSELADEFGIKAVPVKVDVSQAEQIDAMVSTTMKEFGRIDILVNGAGIDLPVSVVEMSEEVWDKTLNVNAKSVFLATKAVAKIMMGQKCGAIVNLSSCCAKTGEKDNSAYCASKAAVTLFTDCCSKEFAKYGIRVNAMCPATIDTPMIDYSLKTRAAVEGKDVKAFEQELLDKIPLGRRGKISETGRLAVFLASDESSFMTGQSVNITGGYEVH